jgi:hypothetical protein
MKLTMTKNMEDMIDSKEIERLRYGGVHSNYIINNSKTRTNLYFYKID